MAMLNFGLIHIWVLAHYSFQKENGVMFGVKEQMVDWLEQKLTLAQVLRVDSIEVGLDYS